MVLLRHLIFLCAAGGGGLELCAADDFPLHCAAMFSNSPQRRWQGEQHNNPPQHVGGEEEMRDSDGGAHLEQCAKTAAEALGEDILAELHGTNFPVLPTLNASTPELHGCCGM